MTPTTAHRQPASTIVLQRPARFRSILCLAEFTPEGHSAAEFADALARRHDAELTLLHVARPGRLKTALQDPGADHLMSLAACSGAQLHLAEMRRPLGTTAMTLLRAARRGQHDLIVLPMPSNTRRWLSWRPVVGAVLAAAPCPVIAGKNFEGGVDGPVLCAADESRWHRPALGAAELLAQNLESPLYFVQEGKRADAYGNVFVERGPQEKALAKVAARVDASMIVTPRHLPDTPMELICAPIPRLLETSPCPVLHV